MVLHGGVMNHGLQGEKFMRKSGLLETADAFNVIMVFPQMATFDLGNGFVAVWEAGWNVTSPLAVNEPEFYTKEAKQMVVLKAIFDRVLESTEVPETVAALPALNANGPTMSGFSAGGFMTTQFHMAYRIQFQRPLFKI